MLWFWASLFVSLAGWVVWLGDVAGWVMRLVVCCGLGWAGPPLPLQSAPTAPWRILYRRLRFVGGVRVEATLSTPGKRRTVPLLPVLDMRPKRTVIRYGVAS